MVVATGKEMSGGVVGDILRGLSFHIHDIVLAFMALFLGTGSCWRYDDQVFEQCKNGSVIAASFIYKKIVDIPSFL